MTSSYILPHFDYCNQHLFNLASTKYKHFRLYKSVRDIFTIHRKTTNTTLTRTIIPFLKRLHWLPIIYSINYKLSLIIHMLYSQLDLATHFFYKSLIYTTVIRYVSGHLRVSSLRPIAIL